MRLASLSDIGDLNIICFYFVLAPGSMCSSFSDPRRGNSTVLLLLYKKLSYKERRPFNLKMDKIRTKPVENHEGGLGTVFLHICFPPCNYEVRPSTQSIPPKD